MEAATPGQRLGPPPKGPPPVPPPVTQTPLGACDETVTVILAAMESVAADDLLPVHERIRMFHALKRRFEDCVYQCQPVDDAKWPKLDSTIGGGKGVGKAGETA